MESLITLRAVYSFTEKKVEVLEMFKLVSSNESKLKEFRRLGLENLKIEKGLDLPEVDADSETVVLYKALAAGEKCIVEDTALHIEGESVGVNVRWLLSEISKFAGKKARWEVLLGVNTGKQILIYKGEIHGVITDKYCDQNKGFGFDSFFIPDGEVRTLYELEEEGEKDIYSARKKAVLSLMAIKNEAIKVVNVGDVTVWEGPMQK